MDVQLALTDQDILKCRDTIRALRPHLPEDLYLLTIATMHTVYT